jgi:CPA1 family monovalent cation:H+ antiporter
MSISILVLGKFGLDFSHLRQLVGGFSFSNFLMEYLLCFLLFAGALHVDFEILKSQKWAVLIFTLFGVLFSTFMIGFVLHWVAPLLGFSIPLIYCLLFGALISPTDPIAVLGILKQAKVPKSEEIIISGESLFNDGVGVVVFLTILQLSGSGVAEINYLEIAKLFGVEVIGGVFLGFILGFFGDKILGSIDHYQTEVMLTLAIVMGGYALASVLHTSGPLAMVVAGLYIGNVGLHRSMSNITQQYVTTFWEIIDELLNAFLFVIIGLEILTIEDLSKFSIIAFVSILIVLLMRFLSIIIPFKFGRFKKKINKNFPYIMTWGGLRGGISIALALSLPESDYKDVLVAITYITVLFSVVVQGLSLGMLVNYFKTK